MNGGWLSPPQVGTTDISAPFLTPPPSLFLLWWSWTNGHGSLRIHVLKLEPQDRRNLFLAF